MWIRLRIACVERLRCNAINGWQTVSIILPSVASHDHIPCSTEQIPKPIAAVRAHEKSSEFRCPVFRLWLLIRWRTNRVLLGWLWILRFKENFGMARRFLTVTKATDSMEFDIANTSDGNIIPKGTRVAFVPESHVLTISSCLPYSRDGRCLHSLLMVVWMLLLVSPDMVFRHQEKPNSRLPVVSWSSHIRCMTTVESGDR